MTQVVTPSEITNGQIGKLQDLLRIALLGKGLQNKPTQEVLETQGAAIIADIAAMITKRVGQVSNLIVRRVTVLDRSADDALKATGRNLYIDKNVVKATPLGKVGELDVCFFKPEPWEYTRPGFMSDEDLDKALDRRALKSSDFRPVAAVNEADPVFADDHPHGVHWQDENGNWCFAAFGRWDDERSVYVDRDSVWIDYWWFAGLRK